MIAGKERVARTREVNQLRFEEFLIDDFAHGPPPDPSERRVIPVVYGTARLTAPLLDREIVCALSSKESESFTPGVDDSAVHPTLIPPRPVAAVQAPPAPVQPGEPAEEKTPPVLKRVPNVAPRGPSIPVTPPFATRGQRGNGRQGSEFRWSGFFFGAAMGGLAGAAVLVIVSAL